MNETLSTPSATKPASTASALRTGERAGEGGAVVTRRIYAAACAALPFARMDEALLLAVNGLRPSALDPIAGFLSEWGLFAFLLVLAGRALATRTRTDLESMRDGWLT